MALGREWGFGFTSIWELRTANADLLRALNVTRNVNADSSVEGKRPAM